MTARSSNRPLAWTSRPYPLLLWVATLVSAPLPAAAQQLKLASLQGEFQEALNTDVVVSGGVVVGVDSEHGLDGPVLNGLVIRPGATAAPETICLSAISRDGAYMASNNYEVPAGVGADEPVALPYDSQYRTQLQQYDSTQVAVRATMGSCDSADRHTYAVIHGKSQPPRRLRLFINSFNATDVYVSTSSGQSADCEPLEGRRTSFDYLCAWSWPAHMPASTVVTVHREVYGRPLPEATVTVVRGSNP